MATITFLNGSKQVVESSKALKLHMIRKGLRPSTPEIDKYLENVDSIEFKAKRYDPRPIKHVDVGRLPYND